MFDPRRHAAALAAVLILLAPAGAAAQAPVLLAQIEDATPTPDPQPPLSEDPPEQLDGGDDGDGPAGQEEDEEAAPGTTGLPDTGADAAVTALLGLGLLASGGGLRLTLAGGRGRTR